MVGLLRKILSIPEDVMQRVIRHHVSNEQSGNIITDLNGAARLNIHNPQVRQAMRARMEELADKKQA